MVAASRDRRVVEIAGRAAGTAGSADSAVGRRDHQDPKVAGGGAAGAAEFTQAVGRPVRCAEVRRPAVAALHARRVALGRGVGNARPQADTRGAERAADRRSRDKLFEIHNQAFPRR